MELVWELRKHGRVLGFLFLFQRRGRKLLGQERREKMLRWWLLVLLLPVEKPGLQANPPAPTPLTHNIHAVRARTTSRCGVRMVRKPLSRGIYFLNEARLLLWSEPGWWVQEAQNPEAVEPA